MPETHFHIITLHPGLLFVLNTAGRLSRYSAIHLSNNPLPASSRNHILRAVPTIGGTMKISLCTVAVSTAFASVATAQAASGTLSLAPAATTITTSSPFAPALFPLEAVQLTDEVLANVASAIQNETISSLFVFGSNSTSSAASKRSARQCKLLPGDRLWPVGLLWDIFDLLLGGRLIKATPLAASCYPEWPEYDAGTCATITSEWLTSNLQ